MDLRKVELGWKARAASIDWAYCASIDATCAYYLQTDDLINDRVVALSVQNTLSPTRLQMY